MNYYAPKISVVIRNRNEAGHLKHVLSALAQQEYSDYEIVIVDNNSTDDSIEVAQTAGVKLITINDFTYGRALNRGIEAVSGEVVVILSAHSIPLGRYFLTECVQAFENERVGAVRLIYAGKGADITRWFDAELLENTEQDFISKGPLASGCVIRRSAWEEVRFDEEAIAAEEKIWTAEILKKGYTVISPIPAFYYYSKQLSPTHQLYKDYRELVAINQRFGWRIGFLKPSIARMTSNFCISILSSIYIAVKNIQLETIRLYLRMKFPKL